VKELGFRRGVKKLQKLLVAEGLLYIMNIFLSRRAIVPIAYIEQYVLKYKSYSSAAGKSDRRGKSNLKNCLLKKS